MKPKRILPAIALAIALAVPIAGTGCNGKQPLEVVQQHGPQAIEAAYTALGNAFAITRHLRQSGAITPEQTAQAFAALDRAADLVIEAEQLTGVAQAAKLAEARYKIEEAKK